MQAARIQRAAPAAIALSAVLAGCGSSPPTRFYVLSDVAEAPASPSVRQVSVGVGPLRLPGYLDRPQIVTRPSSTDLRVAEFHRWAEPLRASVGRVLGDNLSKLLATERVYEYPWELGSAPRYRVAIDVSRFEASPGSALLVARWTLTRGPKGEVLALKRARLTEPADTGDYSAVAHALSELLGRLSQEIAGAIEAAESADASG